MNYIQLINLFWQTRREVRITSVEADLYFFLLQESNNRDWENPFECPNGLICVTIGVTEKTMIEARNRLQQKGLIKFESGKRKMKSPVYTILNCNIYSKKVSIKVSKNDSKKVSKNRNNIYINKTETKTKESNTDVLPKKEDSSSAHINYQKIKDDYNTMFTGKLPAVSTLTDKRKSAIRSRISEHGISSVQRVFDNVLKSPFLLGCNNRNWKCNFDWMFAPTNFLKILEGNYIQHGQVSYTTEIRAYSTSEKAASRDALEKEANRILQQFAAEDS
ncbi:hypothetical protein [Coprobacter sp.]|uniref:hypothetical protein n=1 Tax=Coprobacter sp. TaxID=1941478 RepID=UPI003AB6C366